jgi:hypothetical protein
MSAAKLYPFSFLEAAKLVLLEKVRAFHQADTLTFLNFGHGF